jgi:hypothetical protein
MLAAVRPIPSRVEAGFVRVPYCSLSGCRRRRSGGSGESRAGRTSTFDQYEAPSRHPDNGPAYPRHSILPRADAVLGFYSRAAGLVEPELNLVVCPLCLRSFPLQ